MIAALLIALVQAVGTPETPSDAPPAAQETPAPGMMRCEPWDRGTRTRQCTTAEGEVLRCRQEQRLGSRFPTTVCLSYRQEQELEEDTRRYIDRQQHIPDNRGG
jgi:hypothetical protein